MPHLYLSIELDNPFEAHEIQTALVSELRQQHYSVELAPTDPDAVQTMGLSLLEIIQAGQQMGQHILENTDFYQDWLVALTTIAAYFKEQQAYKTKVIEATNGSKTYQLASSAAENEALLRELVLNNEAVTIRIRDRVS